MTFAAAALAISQTTVVMIHGAGGGGWEYDLWKPVFEKAGYKVIARDLIPAKGGLAHTNVTHYLDQVVSWCPKTGRVVIVGASMGGILALMAAQEVFPARVVLVNSVPSDEIAQLPMSEPAPDVVQWANGPLKDTEVSMPDSDRKTILWAWKKWRNESGTVMNQIRTGIIVNRPNCPSLVVIGGNDTDISPEISFKSAGMYSSQVLYYPKMSHVGPLLSTKAKSVAADVIEWLKTPRK